MGCLNEITDNEFGKSLYHKYNDVGLYTEVSIIYHSEVNNAGEKGSSFARSLKQVNYPTNVEGRIQGYSQCIDYTIYSKEIDSLAREAYERLKNGKMEYIYD